MDEILTTNVRGPFAVVRTMGSNIAYCASKAAVDNMTKFLPRPRSPTPLSSNRWTR
jgi:3-oxoacyl-[acyl-carrier protein] reductase